MSEILASSVVAALVAGLFAYRLGATRIQIENVTKERAKWRSELKVLVIELIDTVRNEESEKAEKLISQIQLNLNPFDRDDKLLLEAGRKMVGSEDVGAAIKTFTEHVSLLLKHDWQRAKSESRVGGVLTKNPERVSHDNYLRSEVGASVNTLRVRDHSGSLALSFIGLMLASGTLFFLAVGLKQPFSELLQHFNDPQVAKTFGDWLIFVFVSALFGSVWSGFYLWFKNCEKSFLDQWRK